jgi:hypothetical protein
MLEQLPQVSKESSTGFDAIGFLQRAYKKENNVCVRVEETKYCNEEQGRSTKTYKACNMAVNQKN